MPTIVIPDDSPAVMAPSAAFHTLAGLDVRVYDTRPSTPEELIERIVDADVAINIRASTRFTKELLGKVRKLRTFRLFRSILGFSWITIAEEMKSPFNQPEESPGGVVNVVSPHVSGFLRGYWV
jgi:phosphoglycerate dehydrogenase-like enzyme